MKKNLVVLSGAGISAESGIQTFRDGDGLWENHKVEDVATPEAWNKNPELVLDFYNMRRKQVVQAKPNRAHLLLAEMENMFDVQIVTQNIDDLHERAGSSKVLHLHGEILKKRCSVNESNVQPAEMEMSHTPSNTGGYWRPHIVWFGEDVPMLENAIELTFNADLFLIVGTSLLVYPAASLAQYTSALCDKWIIDPKIPPHIPADFHVIKQRASDGMEMFYHTMLGPIDPALQSFLFGLTPKQIQSI